MTGLVRYEAARHALQVARDIDEVKDIRDKAQAMAAYAKQAQDTELVEWATEIKVRAERRAGEMLAEMKVNGSRHDGVNAKNLRESHDTTPEAPTLEKLGVSRDQSSRWQKLAAIPEDKFEEAVAAAKEVAHEVTTAAMLRVAAPPADSERVQKIEINEPGTAAALSKRTDDHLKTIQALQKAEARIAELEADLADMTEKRDALAAIADSADAFKNKDEFKAMVKLRNDLFTMTKSRDYFQNDSGQKTAQVAHWKRRAEKCEGKK